MQRKIRIGLIGDRSDEVRAHAAIPRAFELLAAAGGPRAELEWLPTKDLAGQHDDDLRSFDGLWAVPGSPYVNMEGALRAIRFAREQDKPFLGTCGGFQHAVIEVARHVMGLKDADHTESNPKTRSPIIHALSCSLVGTRGNVSLAPGSAIGRIYGEASIVEPYHCSYGVNATYLDLIQRSPLKFVAADDNGDIRAVEIPGHPFFIATLFQHELVALDGRVSPLTRAFADAAANAAA